jgi:hypothetical protein
MGYGERYLDDFRDDFRDNFRDGCVGEEGECSKPDVVAFWRDGSEFERTSWS